MLELCLMLSTTYYAQNYADIIGLGLLTRYERLSSSLFRCLEGWDFTRKACSWQYFIQFCFAVFSSVDVREWLSLLLGIIRDCWWNTEHILSMQGAGFESYSCLVSSLDGGHCCDEWLTAEARTHLLWLQLIVGRQTKGLTLAISLGLLAMQGHTTIMMCWIAHNWGLWWGGLQRYPQLGNASRYM